MAALPQALAVLEERFSVSTRDEYSDDFFLVILYDQDSCFYDNKIHKESRYMSLEFLDTDFEKVSYLQNLLIAHATGKPADGNEFKILRHQLLNDSRLAKKLPKWLKLYSDLESFWNFIQPKFASYAERRTYLSQQFTPILDELEKIDDSDFSKSKSYIAASQEIFHVKSEVKAVERNKRNIFVVHGRDNEAKQEVSRFIESLGLKAIILHEQASGGRTIIEKIEHYAGEANFAIVLYTPCDHGRGVFERNVPPKNRARQNVVFEHGYLMALLGRENVCALVKGDIETPNDISGVVYVPLDNHGGWKKSVLTELDACGYEVPLF